MINKKNKDFNLNLYAITPNFNADNSDNYFKKIELALKNGVTLLQLREKKLNGNALLNLAKSVKLICDKYNVPLIINDHPEIAREINAAGVHVGQSDTDALMAREILGDKKIIGVSAKTLEEAKKAEENGADYLGVGAIYNTNSKDDAKTISMETLTEITEEVDIPVVAIGGIHYENIMSLSGTNIAGISVISEIFSNDVCSIGLNNSVNHGTNDESMKKSIYNVEDVFVPKIEEKTKTLRIKVEHMLNSTLPTVLTIAGSDPSGGAGIQADIKTLMANEIFAMSAITAVTAQNSKEVLGVLPVMPEFLSLQLKSVFEDIKLDAIKIGMVENIDNVRVITDILSKYKAKNIVIDPLIISSSGKKLIKDDAISLMEEKLFPMTSLITPNINEAYKLSGIEQSQLKKIDITSIEMLGKILYDKYKTNILIKGGHNLGKEAMDLLISGDSLTWFSSATVKNLNTHGTGCTLSSAIAANLAKGYELNSSIFLAKKYLTRVIKSGLNLCEENGPMDHSLCLGKYL